MPLYTHLSSLGLDLNQNVNNAALEHVLEKGFAANLSSAIVMNEEDPINPIIEINKELWGLIQAKEEVVLDHFIKALNNIAKFDEKTWVLLHLLCARSNLILNLSFFMQLIPWIQANPDSENAMQGRLFLMSQPHFEVDFAKDQEFAPYILESNDPWAFFALLTHPKFNVLSTIMGLREAINQALLNSTCVACINEKKKDESQSLLWVFLRSSGINNEQKEKLLRVKEKLLRDIAFFNFTEEVMQWPAEVLSTLISLSNDVTDDSTLNFRAVLFRSYIFKVPVTLSTKQQVEIDKKSHKNHWSSEQKTNAELTILQSGYFVVIDKFLSSIGVKGFLNAIQNKSDLTDKLNLILNLSIVNNGQPQFNVANRFLGGIFKIIWGINLDTPQHISEDSLEWLLDLDIFKNYFNYPLIQTSLSRAISDLQAILQVPRVPDAPSLVEKFFSPKDFYSEGELQWDRFPGNYFSAMLIAVTKYAALPKADAKFKNDPKVKQAIELYYIFSPERRAKDLQGMSVRLNSSAVFVRALKDYYAPMLMQVLANQNTKEKEVSYKRIRRIADLVKLLSIDEQKNLYKNTAYILFRLQNRLMKYEHQQERYGKSATKESKIKFIRWVIQNLSRIESAKEDDPSFFPMKHAYHCIEEKCEVWVREDDRVTIKRWLEEVIFHNSPRAQAVARKAQAVAGFFSSHASGVKKGMKGNENVENGMKGSKAAETLALLREDLVRKLLMNSEFSFEDLFRKAYPGRDFDEREDVYNEEMQRDLIDDAADVDVVSSVGSNSDHGMVQMMDLGEGRQSPTDFVL